MSAHASEGSETDDSVDANVSTQVVRGRRSKIWEHYEQDLVEVEGDFKAVCKYCKLKLHTKSGTSSLRGHIAESCKGIAEDVRKHFILTMKKQPCDDFFL
ncbi:hypothetical protein QOZ80_8AG0633450 [Eleusine coracana subsp. coracana]|nr:hypothetical protein QOZ80_8AG0633450 [Eleusine coracana subsp. coracana]